MTAAVDIRPVTPLGPLIAPFRDEAARQGFRLIDNLVRDWERGANRFEQPGECFLGAFVDEVLVGVGGLNRDPYADRDSVARIRHVYVLNRCRRAGVGRRLVLALLDRALAAFDAVRLRTDTAAGAAFYASLGFRETGGDEATHSLAMTTHAQPITKGD